jgi:hypothetical protein
VVQPLESSWANSSRPERVQEIKCRKPPALFQSAYFTPPPFSQWLYHWLISSAPPAREPFDFERLSKTESLQPKTVYGLPKQ